MKTYLFLSPHLDDTVLSCGAIVDYLIKTGNHVHIWTIFAGETNTSEISPFAQSLHDRWKLSTNPIAVRKQEDINACNLLNAAYKHFNYQDCIYRKSTLDRFLVNGEEDLYQPIPEDQAYLVQELYKILINIPAETFIISPLSIGNHIDHRITKSAVDNLKDRPILYYADYPYTVKNRDKVSNWVKHDWQMVSFPINTKNIQNWIEAIACHQSQISTFWESKENLKKEIIQYAKKGGGSSLWIKAAL